MPNLTTVTPPVTSCELIIGIAFFNVVAICAEQPFVCTYFNLW